MDPSSSLGQDTALLLSGITSCSNHTTNTSADPHNRRNSPTPSSAFFLNFAICNETYSPVHQLELARRIQCFVALNPMIGVLEARGHGVSVLRSPAPTCSSSPMPSGAPTTNALVPWSLAITTYQRAARELPGPACPASPMPSRVRDHPRPRASRPRRQRVARARARATLARGGPASVIQCLLTRDRIGITSSQHKGVGRLSPAHRFHCTELLSTIGQREGDQYSMTARPTSDLFQATC